MSLSKKTKRNFHFMALLNVFFILFFVCDKYFDSFYFQPPSCSYSGKTQIKITVMILLLNFPFVRKKRTEKPAPYRVECLKSLHHVQSEAIFIKY